MCCYVDREPLPDASTGTDVDDLVNRRAPRKLGAYMILSVVGDSIGMHSEHMSHYRDMASGRQVSLWRRSRVDDCPITDRTPVPGLLR